MVSYDRIKRNACVFKHFIRRELRIFIDDYWNTFLDSLSWPMLTAFVFGYVFPHMGVEGEFGSFMIIGSIVALCYFTSLELGASSLTRDFDTERRIDFELTLPVSASVIVARHGITTALRAFLMTFPLPFLGKLVLWDRFDLSQFSLPKLVIVYALFNCAFSFAAIWIAGLVANKDFMHFRIRFIDSVFFIGCFMYPWSKLYMTLPSAAYIMLLNPMTHAMEATRVAFLGQAGFLNFWMSCAVLAGQSVLFYYLAIRSWKKRLDYVVVK